ncbi:hypothetical protein TRAPUB_10043 [Trametes pubescens]|uniref:Uncharacterized protein n=1 Tax=Trametes pubescens TaxID=154538 RepID=A0A1M2W0P0_TRAPU|nr:hypothetical protein TRAPUB_10043 [Trametes pubescens]
MPSLKRKDASSDEEDAFTTSPVRGASYEPPRRSLSPAPSPKRRRCDVLESGMSQLTLDGRPIPPSPAHPGQFPPQYSVPAAAGAPTILFPITPSTSTQSVSSLWADGLQVSPVLPAITPALQTSVVLPGSVEEPTSPEALAPTAMDPDVQDVSMKVPSWYEIEKDRIVITDLEDSDAEDGDGDASKDSSSSGAPQFTISSALLDRLPKPSSGLGPLAPDPNPTNALVLYRPLPLPASSSHEDQDDARDTPRWSENASRIGGVFTEDEPIMEDTEMPVDDDQIEFTSVVGSTGEPADDEPMDIEML